jgi:site-specific recombinase XerD
MIVVRCGKGGKRRLVLMDEWGWRELDRWLQIRATMRVGQIFCVLDGPSAGRALLDSDVRRQLRRVGQDAGIRQRLHAHGLRHTHACELYREGVDIYAIQAQLGHASLAVTEAYLRGMAVTEVLAPIGRRRPPMVKLT